MHEHDAERVDKIRRAGCGNLAERAGRAEVDTEAAILLFTMVSASERRRMAVAVFSRSNSGALSVCLRNHIARRKEVEHAA